MSLVPMQNIPARQPVSSSMASSSAIRKGMAALLSLGLGLAMTHNLVSLANAAPRGKTLTFIRDARKGLVKAADIALVEEMCSLLIGCKNVPLPAPGDDLGACVRILWGELSKPETIKFSRTMRECSATASSCSTLRRCALRGAKPNICAGRGKRKRFSFCDSAGRAVTCHKGKIVSVRNCPGAGEQCSAKRGHATCTLGACSKSIVPNGKPVCSGNKERIFMCDQRKLLTFSCASFGLGCTMTPKGRPTCAPLVGESCVAGDGGSCSGNVFTGCVSGRKVKVDCGAAKMTCNKRSGRKKHQKVGVCWDPQGVGNVHKKKSKSSPIKKCNPKRYKSRCVKAGNRVAKTVRYCAGGEVRDFFCGGLNFSKCTGRTGSAHCAM